MAVQQEKGGKPTCWAAATGKCTPQRGCGTDCPYYSPARAEMRNGPLISLAEFTRGRDKGRRVEHGALAPA